MLLVGQVTRGFGLAAGNLAHVTDLICRRTGLCRLEPGTLNIRLDAPYLFDPDAEVTAQEYNAWEHLKLKRCCIRGVRGVVVRPHTHEAGNGHGPAYLEILAEVRLRSVLGLEDGDVVGIGLGGHLPCWAAPPAGSSLR